MKRLLLFLLAALMLSGCAQQPAQQPTESTEEQANELYVENSSAEQKSGGAVREYELKETYFGLSSMGTNLLVMGQNGLLVLAGERGEVIAALQTEEITAGTVLDTAATGMAYYLPDKRQVIVRNPMLQSSTQLQLPENIVGEPLISLSKNEIYYSTGTEIRAMHIDTGISRLIRQQSSATQSLLGIYFDGSVLLRQFAEGGGAPQGEYISTQTGESLGDRAGVTQLFTHGTRYVANWQDGFVHQVAFGVRGQSEAYRFVIPEAEGTRWGLESVLALNGMVSYETVGGNLTLSFYDLQTGLRTAEVSIPEAEKPTRIHSDGKHVWVLCADKLYRWDISKSSVQDETIYTAPLYTAQKPDTEGLAQCQSLADSMSTQYGVKLLIWQKAAQKTGEYTVVAEHHPMVITDALERLQPILAQFPKGFLQKTVGNGWIRIALVRSIDGHDKAVHFWEDGDCWILLPIQSEPSAVEKIAYAVVSHVRGNSRDLDEDRWTPLNPEGFVYTENNSEPEDNGYLQGENRAFADLLSMTYPYEDQSRVFYYAMLADNGEMFQSPIMQAKLMRVCMGIREAYRLKKNTNTFVWEQYLQTSLAYTGK